MVFKPVASAFSALGFTRLSPVSYIYTPTSTSTTLSTSDSNRFSGVHAVSSTTFKSPVSCPDLIIFPSWLDALPKHTAKYLVAYQKLYPQSTIIVITHKILDSILGTYSNKLLWYGPVVDYIQSLPSRTSLQPDANILLHSASNGGALSIVSVAQMYRERTGRPLPIRAQVLDSSPGKPSFWSDIDAVTVGIPSLPLRLLAKVLITFGSFLAKMLYVLIRKQHPIIVLRAKMVDAGLFNVEAPRVYIYSKEDRMVGWKAVEEHVADAREKGYKAEGEEFKGSKHVAHMMMDPARYWGIIERLWGGAVQENGVLIGDGELKRINEENEEMGSHTQADILQC